MNLTSKHSPQVFIIKAHWIYHLFLGRRSTKDPGSTDRISISSKTWQRAESSLLWKDLFLEAERVQAEGIERRVIGRSRTERKQTVRVIKQQVFTAAPRLVPWSGSGLGSRCWIAANWFSRSPNNHIFTPKKLPVSQTERLQWVDVEDYFNNATGTKSPGNLLSIIHNHSASSHKGFILWAPPAGWSVTVWSIDRYKDGRHESQNISLAPWWLAAV